MNQKRKANEIIKEKMAEDTIKVKALLGAPSSAAVEIRPTYLGSPALSSSLVSATFTPPHAEIGYSSGY